MLAEPGGPLHFQDLVVDVVDAVGVDDLQSLVAAEVDGELDRVGVDGRQGAQVVAEQLPLAADLIAVDHVGARLGHRGTVVEHVAGPGADEDAVHLAAG